MSLQEWLQNGWLKAQGTSPTEIQELLKVVARELHDCQIAGLSIDGQFEHAYNAALQAATIALRAEGYQGMGRGENHYHVIESLAKTIGDGDAAFNLNALRKKRNQCTYDREGGISESELKEMIALATDLQARVEAWLRKNHADLLKPQPRRQR